MSINRKTAKKTWVLFCLVVLLVMQSFSFSSDFTSVAAAASRDIQITTFSTDKDPNPIQKDDMFTITVNFKNTTAAAINVTGVRVDLASDFFRLGVGDTVMGPGSVLSNVQTSVSIDRLKRKNAGGELILIFYYTIGGIAKTSRHTLFLNVAAERESPAPVAPTDTRRFDPLVGIEDDFSRPVLAAGREVVLSLPLTIGTNHAAKDVEITLEFDEKLQPYIDFMDAKLLQRIDRMLARKTEDVEFTFRICSLAAAGNYTLKINYRYLNSFNDVFTSSETIQIRVTNTRTLPELVIKDVGISTPEARRGEVVTLYILLENRGSLPADDVVVHLTGLDNNLLTLFNSTNERRLGRITGRRTGKVYYDLMVATNARSSNLQFNVKVAYQDHGNNKHSLESTGFAQLDLVGAAGDKPIVIIENLQVPEQAVDTQENFAITFDVKNIAGTDAQNLKITIGTGGNIIPKSLNTIIHPRLAAGEIKNVTFLLSATADAAPKNHAIPINIEYEEIIGNESIKHSATQYVGVNIAGNERGQTVPKIIIDKFTVGENEIQAEIKAGKAFDLTLSFFNTNKLLSVRNIKATITSGDGSFTPVKGSNMFFIDHIAAGGRVERSIRLFPEVDLATRSYLLTIKLEYEDELGLRGAVGQGQQHLANIEISLPVVQEPRLKIDNLEIPSAAQIGMPAIIFADFYNMGRSTLNNLLVRVEGDFEGEALSWFVGNFFNCSWCNYWDCFHSGYGVIGRGS